MNENDNKFVNLDNARVDEQRQVMREIEDNQECPFCQENLAKYHKQEIFRKGAHWILTKNQWPYEHTKNHLLAISAYHAETPLDLKEGSFDELQGHVNWALDEFGIKAGGVCMRFGSVALNGATVSHLHVHIIEPSDDLPEGEKVRFKISR